MTTLAAVIGSPVRHSLSPAMHNAVFEQGGLDWTFTRLDVVAGGADRPVEQEAGHRRRGEERTARLALRRVVTGCHAHHRAGTHRQPGVDPPVTARG